jgi:hypothetical protein
VPPPIVNPSHCFTVRSRKLPDALSPRPSPDVPWLLRNVARFATGRIVGLVFGSAAFVAGGLWLVLAPDQFAGARLRLLFVSFVVDEAAVRIFGVVAMFFFGLTGSIGVWELTRRR